jgi:hypothetical protein
MSDILTYAPVILRQRLETEVSQLEAAAARAQAESNAAARRANEAVELVSNLPLFFTLPYFFVLHRRA